MRNTSLVTIESMDSSRNNCDYQQRGSHMHALSTVNWHLALSVKETGHKGGQS